MKKYTIISIQKLPQSEQEIKISIEPKVLDEAFEATILEKAKEIELPGFRKGKVPRDVLLAQFGEMSFLDDAAEKALGEVYSEIITETKIQPIGSPKVTVTKLAKGNPFECTLIIAVIPDIKLPSYKKIAKEIMSQSSDIEISQKDIDDVILEVRKHHAHMELHKNGTFKDHNHQEIKEDELPELTDDTVKQFGDFKNIDDMREKISENLKMEKTTQLKDKRRMDVIEKISEETIIEIPKILIENELDMMIAQFEGDISRAGMTLDSYLQSVNKKIEDIRNEWKETAEKKAKAQLIISKIAVEEKIIADSEKVRTETEKLLTIYPGSDPVRARSYVAMMLTNERVFELFESQK